MIIVPVMTGVFYNRLRSQATHGNRRRRGWIGALPNRADRGGISFAGSTSTLTGHTVTDRERGNDK
jgi:hypothetical protein